MYTFKGYTLLSLGQLDNFTWVVFLSQFHSVPYKRYILCVVYDGCKGMLTLLPLKTGGRGLLTWREDGAPHHSIGEDVLKVWWESMKTEIVKKSKFILISAFADVVWLLGQIPHNEADLCPVINSLSNHYHVSCWSWMWSNKYYYTTNLHIKVRSILGIQVFFHHICAKAALIPAEEEKPDEE